MKEIFEYMGIKPKKITGLPDCLGRRKIRYVYKAKKDGNGMVLAINKMKEKRDWSTFCWYCIRTVWIHTDDAKSKSMEESAPCLWLFKNPTNFFKLMKNWLEER